MAAMDQSRLHPWMLSADCREDPRPWLWLNLAEWPSDVPIDPMPPMPLIGIGADDHPLASQVDIVLGQELALARIGEQIALTPQASAALVQLLRAAHRAEPKAALAMESMAYAMLQAGAEHILWKGSRKHAAPCAPGVLRLARSEDQLDLLIDRPSALNAIDRSLRDALFEAFALAALDDSIARIQLRAVGRTFSIGADLAEFGTTRDPVEAHAIRMRTLPAWPLLERAALLEIHVQGACIGSGLELAAFADRLTASPRAWFQLPETSMGILPGFGGTVSVTRRIGRQRAALLMLSGRRIDARTALRWGLIDAIVDDPSPDQCRPDMLGSEVRPHRGPR